MNHFLIDTPDASQKRLNVCRFVVCYQYIKSHKTDNHCVVNMRNLAGKRWKMVENGGKRWKKYAIHSNRFSCFTLSSVIPTVKLFSPGYLTWFWSGTYHRSFKNIPVPYIFIPNFPKKYTRPYTNFPKKVCLTFYQFSEHVYPTHSLYQNRKN